MAKRSDRNGFYFQLDFWESIAHLPVPQQDKAIGAMVRLFFTGADAPPKGSAPMSAYLGVKSRIICSRNKSAGSEDDALDEAPEDTTKVPTNDHVSIKEGEGDSSYTSTSEIDSQVSIQPVTIPQVETDLNEVGFFPGKAILVFDEVMGSRTLMPSPMELGYLDRIGAAGYTLDDVRLVCEHMKREWGDDRKMKRFLRIRTILEPSKFEGYLRDARNSTEVKSDAEAAEFAGAF